MERSQRGAPAATRGAPNLVSGAEFASRMVKTANIAAVKGASIEPAEVDELGMVQSLSL